MALGTPSQRDFLRWFHQLEDDSSRNQALLNGSSLIQTAQSDRLIDAEDVDGFAFVALGCADEDLINFDHVAREIDQFGQNSSYDLQQATNFRLTAKGRQWLAEPVPSQLINVSDSQVGQLAGGNINNLTLIQFLDAVADEIDKVPASESDREDARDFLRRMREGAGDLATGAGAGVLAQAIARAAGVG